MNVTLIFQPIPKVSYFLKHLKHIGGSKSAEATGALELQRKEEAFQARKKWREKNPSP